MGITVYNEIIGNIKTSTAKVRNKMKKRTAFIILILNVIADRAFACSGFYIAKDSIIVMCKNTDATDWKSKIWFTPATDTIFGYVCFGFEFPYLSDGMNDKGLVVSHILLLAVIPIIPY
jgi:penicillin V acylase-like amidase (Ntn superfamily)